MENECIASSKGSEFIIVARNNLRALGVPEDGPTLLGTDNLANYRVASGIGCPTRSRSFLRRYRNLKQCIAAGERELRHHVADANMPADFLTKHIPRAKLNKSVRYATN